MADTAALLPPAIADWLLVVVLTATADTCNFPGLGQGGRRPWQQGYWPQLADTSQLS